MSDTIFALSSGSPPAAIAVMRISGSRALEAVARLAGVLPAPRHATLRTLTDPADGTALDRALVLVFPGPASATGEDLAELHLHGGRAVVRGVAGALAAIPGLRAAEAGEFTRRALTNGRIDLTEAEGLADLLAAETDAQRRAALTNAEGGLRRLVEAWTARAVTMAAMVEAAIDHADEADVDEDAILAGMRAEIASLAREIGVTLAQPPAERVRDGVRVVFAGPPNSGKSTLFNRMAGREAAITSPIAGTTRDRIEAPVSRDGIAWLLIDTAGLADATDDPIEAVGIERSRAAMAAADIVLWLGDAEPPANAVPVHARSDAPHRQTVPPGRIAASGIDPRGADELWAALGRRAAQLVASGAEPLLNMRQRDLCIAAQTALLQAAEAHDVLIVAEELRVALGRFDALTGRAHIEAVLDTLFGRFCVGK